ncbi:phosphatase PAP2 family protein [Rufibacter sp. LB8]|uniref:phosphatase PAP2 family protein n=1 Tax=Rufibacter sp. LB8 TaxID=2777781 RepID=UPI00178C3FB3|nr:phosphatase PAP2 family protein [Rufibacter sp. LB8]
MKAVSPTIFTKFLIRVALTLATFCLGHTSFAVHFSSDSISAVASPSTSELKTTDGTGFPEFNRTYFLLGDTVEALPVKRGWSREKKKFVWSAAGAVATFGLGLAAYHWVDEPLKEFVQRNATPFTRDISETIEPFGTSERLHATFGSLFMVGLVTKNRKLRQVATISLASYYLNSMMTSQLKKTFRRARPLYAEDNDEFNGPASSYEYASLPSSHTSNAFATATAVATIYRDKGWVPPVAYGIATLVGLSRIHDNAHWASDVIAGAAVGYVSAKVTHWTYFQLKDRLQGNKWQFFPNVGKGSASLSATLQF